MPEENMQQSGTLYSNPEPVSHPETPVSEAPKENKKEQKEDILISWVSPSRSFQLKSRDFYVKLISMAVLFGVVLFIIDGIMPVLLIVSLLFLFYVLNTVQPENVEYKISNKGIYVADKRTDWANLGRFWFINRSGNEFLAVEANNLTGRLEMIIPEDKREKIEEVLSNHLTHEQVPPTFFDKAAQWASTRLPLE